MPVAGRLRRALAADAGRAGVTITITSSTATRWASATFTGARHELIVGAAADDDADRWLSELPEAELALYGHLIADLKIVAMRQAGGILSATLEVLTVEEA